ncbi:GGDEF domain-containing protein, partial [Streptomyces lonarensis]
MESVRAGRAVGRARPGGRPAAGRARTPFAPGPAGLVVLACAVGALVAALGHATVTGQPWLPPGAAGWGLPALAAALAAPSLLPAHRAARPSGAVAPLALAGLLLHGPTAALLLTVLPAVAPAVHRSHRRPALIRAACELVAVAAACAVVTPVGLLPAGEAPWTPEQWWSSAVPALLVGGGVHLAVRGVLTTRCLPPSARPAGPARPAPAAAALLSATPLIIVVAAHAPVLLPLFAPALGALDVALRSARARATDRLLDPLTGLPNRRWLLQRTRAALAEAESGGGRCALVLIDLDRFRSVNDTLGHGTGDRLLLEIAERVERSAPAGAETARLGADEFAVLLPAVASVGAAHRAAREVVRAIEAPVELDGLTVVVEASAGVAVYPDHATARTGPGSVTRGGDVSAHAAGAARPVSHGAGEGPPHPAPPGTGAPDTADTFTEEPGAVAAERSPGPRRPRLPVRGTRRAGDPAAGARAPAAT